SRSPFDPAEHAALAGLQLPHDLALVVGVEPPHRARFLTDDEDPLAAGQRAQNWRVAEIEIGTEVLRTVLVGSARAAADEKRVGRRRLIPPDDLAGLQVHRHDRVARL